MSKHLVFIYGSLRSGGAGAMSIRFPNSKFIADAKVNGSLYDLGPYPGLILDNAGPLVVGEVYEVDDELLSLLDDFESSSNYRRQQVEISFESGRATGWTYEPDTAFYSLQKLIPSGDWIEHSRLKSS